MAVFKPLFETSENDDGQTDRQDLPIMDGHTDSLELPIKTPHNELKKMIKMAFGW